jgi:hypothetical protein
MGEVLAMKLTPILGLGLGLMALTACGNANNDAAQLVRMLPSALAA